MGKMEPWKLVMTKAGFKFLEIVLIFCVDILVGRSG